MSAQTITVAQTPFETQMMSWLYESIGPSSVLELGVWYGGTLVGWMRPGVTLVGVDTLMLDADRWQAWAAEAECELHLIHSSTAAAVDEVARHAPFEFVFVDAGHTYAEVRADWENYRGMVAPGGVMCFHDIQPRPEIEYGVSELWAEIKNSKGARTMEILQRKPYEAPGLTPGYDPGIGVVWM